MIYSNNNCSCNSPGSCTPNCPLKGYAINTPDYAYYKIRIASNNGYGCNREYELSVDYVENEDSNTNNSCSTSDSLNVYGIDNVIWGWIWSSSDDDYYSFYEVAGRTVTIELSSLPADYDLYLYNSNCSSELDSSTFGGTTSESISYTIPSSGWYTVKVDGYSGAYSTSDQYRLRINLP